MFLPGSWCRSSGLWPGRSSRDIFFISQPSGRGAHIRTDFLWDNFTNKTKGWIDTVAYVALFFPALMLLFWVGMEEFNHAFAISERSEQTVWRPLLWPMKLAIPISFLLLMIQGISELIKAWFLARTGKELDHREKVEI
ncbi:MAG: TRAP transporter small permease subunit [Betaproteobacteria bacterium]|nr:TRAP transporter small permease subunit [Betaproteobacteria bacterium]